MPSPRAAAALQDDAPRHPIHTTLPSLPSVTPIDPAALLLRHRDAVTRVRLALGDKALWHAHVLPVLLAWGAMAQGLPRAPRGIWAEPEGLFEAGLMTGLRSLEAIDAFVLGREKEPGRALRYEKRMRLAAFLLGLWAERGTLARVDVRAVGGVWPKEPGKPNGPAEERRFEPALGSLLDFGLEALRAGAELTLDWKIPDWADTAAWLGFEAWTRGDIPKDALWAGSRAAGLAKDRVGEGSLHTLMHLFPPETYVWMKAAPEVLTAMQMILEDAIGAADRPEGRLLSQALLSGRRRVVNDRALQEAKKNARRPALLGWAVLVRHALEMLFTAGLVDLNKTLRQARQSAQPKTSAYGGQAPGGRFAASVGGGAHSPSVPVWWVEDGLWLLWPEGIDIVLRAAAKDQRVREVPDDLALIAEVLVEEGVAVPAPGGGAVHELAFPQRLTGLAGRGTDTSSRGFEDGADGMSPDAHGRAEGLMLANPMRFLSRLRRARNGQEPEKLAVRLRADPLAPPGFEAGEAADRLERLQADAAQEGAESGVPGTGEAEGRAGENGEGAESAQTPAAPRLPDPDGFRFVPSFPPGFSNFVRAAFTRAFDELARTKGPHRWSAGVGVFLPESLFPAEAVGTLAAAGVRSGFLLSEADLADLADLTDLGGLSDMNAPGTGRAAQSKKAGKKEKSLPALTPDPDFLSSQALHVAEREGARAVGFLVRASWVRPCLHWPDGTESEGRWPAPAVRVVVERRAVPMGPVSESASNSARAGEATVSASAPGGESSVSDGRAQAAAQAAARASAPRAPEPAPEVLSRPTGPAEPPPPGPTTAARVSSSQAAKHEHVDAGERVEGPKSSDPAPRAREAAARAAGDSAKPEEVRRPEPNFTSTQASAPRAPTARIPGIPAVTPVLPPGRRPTDPMKPPKPLEEPDSVSDPDPHADPDEDLERLVALEEESLGDCFALEGDLDDLDGDLADCPDDMPDDPDDDA